MAEGLVFFGGTWVVLCFPGIWVYLGVDECGCWMLEFGNGELLGQMRELIELKLPY